MTLRIVFMGTPEFAVPSLSEILAAGYDVVRVYTQPPRKAGRGKSLTKSPVHQFADIMGIPVETPENFRKPSVIDALEDLNADVACVVAYGQILPKRALAAPRYGCLNLHGSKLPRWRGAAPVQRAIMAGDTETAAQIMQMGVGLDTGPILLSEIIPIQNDDNAASLSERMSRIGASLWPRALAAMQRGALVPSEQEGEPTYAAKIDKSEARIDWSKPASEIANLVRGLSPFPGAWCEIAGERIKVHEVKIVNCPGMPGDHGNGTAFYGARIIACNITPEIYRSLSPIPAIELVTVQPAGKNKMSIAEFQRGRRIDPCTFFVDLT